MNDVYNFINSIPTCSEYAQVGCSAFYLPSYFVSVAYLSCLKSCDLAVQTFKDHMIDGETLPLLSEEHLLDTMGLKLGPALKIRSQVRNTCPHSVMGNQLASFITISSIYRTLSKKFVLGGFKMKCDSAVTNDVTVKILWSSQAR